MSEQSEIRVTCPFCQAKGRARAYTTVDVTLEPKLRTVVMDKKLNVYSCKKCRKETLLSNPFLYQDHQKDFMIQLATDEQFSKDEVDSAFEVLDAEAQAVMVTRRVRSYDELMQKIRVLEAQLDDRVLEILKLQIKEQQPELKDAPFLFNAATKDALRFFVATAKGLGRCDIPRDAYRALAEGLKEAGLPANEPDQWRVVDADYAASTWQRLNT